MVGSLLGWKSLLTNLRTSEDCATLLARGDLDRGLMLAYLADCGLTEEHEFHAAARLRRRRICRVSHGVWRWWSIGTQVAA